MAEGKKEYLKIWFSDIEEASDYFDHNQKHLGEFLLNVYRSYAELPTNFSCKRVEKYFKTYQKQINYIKGQKIKGAIRFDKQEVIEPTLIGSLQHTPTHTIGDSLIPKDKREKIKDKEEGVYIEILSCFKSIMGKDLKLNESRKKLINGRISEGYGLEDFKKVIEIKHSEWSKDLKMKQYLTPETLFAGSNFTKYREQSQEIKPARTIREGASKAHNGLVY
jgi:uncharacterized phage protein (TIGR02220 family)